jgi:hypothetical protein
LWRFFPPRKAGNLQQKLEYPNNFRKMAKGRLKKSHWVGLGVCPLRKSTVIASSQKLTETGTVIVMTSRNG